MHTDTEDAGTDKSASTDDSGEPETLGTVSEIETLSACKRRIRATVPVEKVREELDKNYRELAKSIQLPGFRKGRIPRRLLEARFGEEIDADVKQMLLSGSLAEVVEEKELDVVGAPKFDEVKFAKDSDLTYIVDVEVKPEFELPDYHGIEAAREPLEVKDEEVEERLKALQRKYGKLAPVEAPAAGADGLYIGSYDLVRDGEKVKIGTRTTFTPSSQVLHVFFVEDLPARVAQWDIASGAPLRLTVKAGADYPDELLRGADLELEFTLTETRHLELAALDEELAKKLGKATIEEVRADLRSGLEEWRRREEEKKLEGKVLATLADRTSMELPEGLIETISTRKRVDEEHELLEKGFRPEEVQEMLVKAREAAGADKEREQIRREMKEFFILEKIADKEKVFATESDTDKRLGLLASLYGVPVAALREELRSKDRMGELRLSIKHEKTRAFLRSVAKISGPDGVPEASEPGPAKETVSEP